MNKCFISAIFFVLLFLGCEDTKEANNATTKKLNKQVGERIPIEVAERWMGLYGKSDTKYGRENSFEYSVNETLLESVMQIENKLGVAFHHAIDDNGAYHILLITVNQNASLWDSPLIIDVNTSSQISNSTAQAWAQNYENANPGHVFYHFFGINVFEEIISNISFNYFDIEHALNDQGQPQLLLLVWNNKDNPGGRTQSNLLMVYDKSYQCPPCAQ